jgi:hypothetical protein
MEKDNALLPLIAVLKVTNQIIKMIQMLIVMDVKMVTLRFSGGVLRFHVQEILQKTMVRAYALLLMKNVPLDTHQVKPMMKTMIVQLALLDT